MSEWKKVRLGEIANYVNEKIDIKAFDTSLYINTDSMLKDKGGIGTPESIPESGKVTKYQHNDILVSNIRPYFKKIWFSNREGGCSNDVLVFRANDNIDSTFLYYVLSDDSFFDHMMSSANGTKMPRGNRKLIPYFEIPLPPLSTQHRIASILSRYDSLIKNYQKQIKLLEEAAQRLYKEWFVDLRFPGHKNTKIVDGVPEGWAKKSIGEIGIVITGKTPSTSNKENYGGSIPFITIPDMHTGIYPVSSVFLSEKGAESQSKKYIPQGALIVSCIGTAGLVCITKERCQTNQQINSLILDDKEMLHYMYFVFLSLKEHLNNIGSNGATMTNVNKSKFEGIDIVVPSSCIIRDFSQRTTPYFENIKSLQSQLRLLTEARDRLLPKLMSGDIEI